MEKKEYFEISAKQGLTPRCPILDLCQRRAMTIYYFSYFDPNNRTGEFWENVLNQSGELSQEYHKNKIEVQGESPTIIKGNSN